MAIAVAVFSSLFICSYFPLGDALSLNYYDKTCPSVESIITNTVKEAFAEDKTVPAAVLRMHFHDCFIRVLNLALLTLPAYFNLMSSCVNFMFVYIQLTVKFLFLL